MNKIIVGRKEEQEILQDILSSRSAELLAVTGRRRVGKTYLVKSFFADNMDFEFSGILNADTRQQLQNFSLSLARHAKSRKKHEVPENWLEAFHGLASYLQSLKKRKKLVVFIDELPWLDTHKSQFLAAFDWFWNSWASGRNIVVVICGSAASWMLNKVINNRGGLHNRVTKRLHLEPFTLGETEAFLRHKGVSLSRQHIIQLYMVLGGIPHYLKEVKKGQSAMQNISRICFEKNGLLLNEFDNLYKALFADAKLHTDIIFALASKRKGLTRGEILAKTKLKDGGTFSKVLSELEWSGFIASYAPFQKVKKETLYRLSDEYSLFYIKFMHRKKNVNWAQLSSSQTWKIWSGYAFETLCMKHVSKIKEALGIAGVYTETSAFVGRGGRDRDGVQIDMLLDRNDQVINLCEIKYHETPFVITKAYAADLRQKMALFQSETKTRKTLFLTMVTLFGLIQNEHGIGLVQQEIRADALF